MKKEDRYEIICANNKSWKMWWWWWCSTFSGESASQLYERTEELKGKQQMVSCLSHIHIALHCILLSVQFSVAGKKVHDSEEWLGFGCLSCSPVEWVASAPPFLSFCSQPTQVYNQKGRKTVKTLLTNHRLFLGFESDQFF